MHHLRQFKNHRNNVSSLNQSGWVSCRIIAGITVGLWIGASILTGGCGDSPSDQAPNETLNDDRASSRTLEEGRNLGGSTLSDFLPSVIVDRANPDVTDETRETAEPKRGGKLRIRTPSMFSTFNTLLVQQAPDVKVLQHLSDGLVEIDQGTLEYYPGMAWRWDVTDLIKTKNGDVRKGRIISRSEDSITFVPGAWKVHLSDYDIEQQNEQAGSITLAKGRGGETLKGSITERQYVVVIDEGYASDAQAETISLSDIDSYAESFGNASQDYPFLKEECAWRFYIRDGINWHDGEPFSGHDVKFTFDTLFNPHVDAQHNRAAYNFVDEVSVLDDGAIVEFSTKRPYFETLKYLGGSWVTRLYLPKHVFNPDQFGGDEKAFAESFNKHPFNLDPVYTGPYRIKELRTDRLSVERNPDYWKNQLPEGAVERWDRNQPYMDEIHWVLYKESGAVVRDLRNGKLDVEEQVEPVMFNQAETQSREFTDVMVRMEDLAFAYTYIGWNLRKPMFQDIRLREAMSLLIPREEIAENVHLGAAIPVSGPFYVNGPQYDRSITPDPYDPEQARRLLTRAGWLDRDGDGLLEKEIEGKMVPLQFSYSIHNARDYHQKIADIIKERLEQVGAEVTIEKNEWTIFADVVRGGNFDAVRYAWGQEIESDPFSIWHSSQIENKGNNFIAYSNDRVDEICEAYRRELDPQRRWEMAREMHRIIHEEQAQCFLFAFKNFAFYHRDLRGVRFYPSAYNFNYTEWWWKDGRVSEGK